MSKITVGKIIFTTLFIISLVACWCYMGLNTRKEIAIKQLEDTVTLIKKDNENLKKSNTDLESKYSELRNEKIRYYPKYVHDEDYESAYDEGYQKGHDEGYEEGHDEGVEDEKEADHDYYPDPEYPDY